MHATYLNLKEKFDKSSNAFIKAYAASQVNVGANAAMVPIQVFQAYSDAKTVFEPIDDDVKRFMAVFTNAGFISKINKDITTSMDGCTYLPSGLLSIGQNILNLDIQTNNFGAIKMTTGINIHFVNKTDLLQGKMIELPWIKKFSIQPSSSGVTGTKLTDTLVRIYDMGFSDSMRILRNQTIPNTPANLIATAWGKLSHEQQKNFLISLEGNYTMAHFMMLLSKGESSRPMIRELVHKNLLSRPENVVESMKAHLLKTSGGGRSILDKPGMITKMVFGGQVKESMFINLPYPLNILKKYI
jgi:hypothetical protein